MNARAMQLEFERLVQLVNPEYTILNKLDSDTIFYFLNAAQNRFIKLNYMSIDNVRGSIENMRKVNDAFKRLIVNVDLTEVQSIQTGLYGKKYVIPDDATSKFFLYLRSISYVGGTYMDLPADSKTPVPNRLIENEEVDSILPSYFNRPILRNPCCVLEADIKGNTYLTVYTDSYTTLNGVNITYIRMPKKFNVILGPNMVGECELDENVHQDIVELAVEMFVTEAAYRVSGGERPDRRVPGAANKNQ